MSIQEIETETKDLSLPLLPESFYSDRRHDFSQFLPLLYTIQPWRMRERLKTVSVALILCLNIGIDPPDVTKTHPCAKCECWVDPFSLPPQKALEAIGRNLQQQYEASISILSFTFTIYRLIVKVFKIFFL